MLKYLISRIALAIPLLFAVSALTFSIAVAMEANGSIAVQILGEGATQEDIAFLEEELGLDDPLLERFGRWVGDVVRGDLGNSLIKQEPVSNLISEKIWRTLSIVGASLVIGVPLGIVFGVAGSLKPRGIVDRLSSVLSASFIAIPGFLVAIFLAYFISVKWQLLPVNGYISPTENIVGWLKTIALPSLSLAFPTIALVQRQLRSAMDSVLQSKYILAARARGIPFRLIIGRHALRNAMIPTVTAIGFRAVAAIGLTFVVEQVFTIGGLGSLLFDALDKRDVTILQGCLLVIACIVLVVNVIVDSSYSLLNPKMRARK